MSNTLIAIDDGNAVVSIDTIVKFSGNSEDSVQSLVKDYKNELLSFENCNSSRISNPTESFLKVHKIGKNIGKIDWSNVRLNEQQTYFLLTLLKNTENVTRFKMELIKQFFDLREKYQFDMKNEFDKQLADIRKAPRKCNIYKKEDKNFTSCRGLIQHADNIDYTETQIKENLAAQGLIRKIYKRTMYWEITDKGSKSGLFDLDTCATILYDMNQVPQMLKRFELLPQIPNSMKIHVYNGFTGEYHMSFDSQKEAERQLGVAGISGILNGTRGDGKKHIRGMCFRVGDTYPKSIEPLDGKDLIRIFRNINVYKDGKFIDKCKTLKEAGKVGGNGNTQVGRLIESGKPNKYGYTYRYAELEFCKR